MKIKQEKKLPVFNISIIATMSAGKSTFVNALVGTEIFPESNTACTAKITSIYNNNFSTKIGGCALQKGSVQEFSTDLKNDDLIKWNTSKNFDRIILEGNVDNITNSEKIIAIHDTPGTNFSGDKSHKKITFEFLENINLNLIICILNAENLATNDEKSVLGELQKLIQIHKNLEVIFIVNKIDKFDIEKESLVGALENVKTHLAKNGFSNPIIMPSSVKAACLFKMALKGKEKQFTKNEICDFKEMLRQFSKGFITEPKGVSTVKFKSEHSQSEKVIIEDLEYSLCDIEKALYNTGFFHIEKLIDNKTTDVNGGKNDRSLFRIQSVFGKN